MISIEKFYLDLKEEKKNFVKQFRGFGIRENMSLTCFKIHPLCLEMLWKVDNDGRLVNKANNWKADFGWSETTGYVAKIPEETPGLFGPRIGPNTLRPEYPSNSWYSNPEMCWRHGRKYYMSSALYSETNPPVGGIKNSKWTQGTIDSDGYFNLQLANVENFPDRLNFDLNI